MGYNADEVKNECHMQAAFNTPSVLMLFFPITVNKILFFFPLKIGHYRGGSSSVTPLWMTKICLNEFEGSQIKHIRIPCLFYFEHKKKTHIHGCGEKGTLVHCWWECRLVQPLWKIVCNFLKKLKMELPFDLAIPLLRLYPKYSETLIQNNICTPMLIVVQFAIAKCWKQPKCPSVNVWIKKLWYIYIMEYYTAERKKELLPFTTVWMELESIMLR